MNASHPATVALVSLGCPKNLVDSEKIFAHLAEGGLIVGAPMDEADVIIINTCGFLEAARQESLGVIGEALSHKRAGRARRVIVAGCLVNRDAAQLRALVPDVDAIVGVNDRDGILQAVTGTGQVDFASQWAGGIASDAGRFRLTAPHTAYLRIAEGCSQRCTFCTIPDIRGPFRSKLPQAVLAEARELIATGAYELNVIAQDTTGYGADLDEPENLAGLLGQLDRLDDVGWIRLMYAYPRGFTDRLIDAIASAGHVLPYLDIPLQHISDPVLKRMGRRVTRAQTEELIGKLRDRIEGLMIRTTFIAGFPGETDEQFRELLAFVEDVQFDAVGVFAYSPEPGTPAEQLEGAVPASIRQARAEELMLAQQQIAFAKADAMLEDELAILVDGPDEQGQCIGRHYGQAPEIDSVCILTEPVEPGSVLFARVVGSEGYDLIVEPIEESDENAES